MYQPPNYPPNQWAPPNYQPPPRPPQKAWYKTSGGIILMLFLFFPVGLFLMWRYATWGKTAKWAVTGVLAFLFIVSSIVNAATPKQPVTTATQTQQATTPGKPTEAPKPTPTPKPVEHYQIDITNLNVKLVDGKYRYFFQVTNNDTKPFTGSATIGLYNEKQQTSVGPEETFDTTRPIEPGYGTMVYFDINTGPPVVHGAYGITHFKYSITVNGQTVNSGEDPIPDRVGS